MESCFVYDSRLGIDIPSLAKEWDLYSLEARQEYLLAWETIRGKIPDRIKELEGLISLKQEQLDQEENFTVCCSINFEIAELASIINDLWLWYRTSQGLK
ncbi:hypothetical protein [Peribacillus kribbensis]|uniref:hypothetical protein n=1 Tax=Peribacillus kribbensis TaxID=356658 RepID=UPI00047EED02|nr:hypothetical protein [Peribacillus kribbensis]